MPSFWYVQVCSNYANRNTGISLHLNHIENKNRVLWDFGSDLSTRIEPISTQSGASLFFQRILPISVLKGVT